MVLFSNFATENKTIRIRDIERRTTLINEIEDAVYITFNYTAILEVVYEISESKIIHIHGSLRERDGVPILGHGNKARIDRIKILQLDEFYDL